MRVLVADRLPERQLEKLDGRGHDVRYAPWLSAEDLAATIADTEILVVRSTQVTAEVIAAAEQLGLIIRAGAGTNTIDIDYASVRGIYVCNVPGKNAVAVAELTMGLILALDRQIPDNVAELRVDRWEKARFAKARGLKGRHLGIIGMGSIGIEVAIRGRAFGMKVLGLEKPDRPDETVDKLSELGVRLYPDLGALLSECDVVSLHVPLTDQTRGMVDAEFLALMPDGSSLVNTSRSEIVIADDLLDAIDSKNMWAALDVFPDEPDSGAAVYTSALARHPRVYGTHHIGASTEQAQEAIAKQVVKIVDEYCDGGVRSAVNLEERGTDTAVIGVRHQHGLGALGRVFAVLNEAGIHVEHMENHVLSGARAAGAGLHIRGDMTTAIRKEITDIEGILEVAVLRVTR